jgi:hypothetical protein
VFWSLFHDYFLSKAKVDSTAGKRSSSQAESRPFLFYFIR